MGQNDHVDEELSDRVGDMIEGGYFDRDETALGIARKVMSDGQHSLSPAQQAVWEKRVMQILAQPITPEEEFKTALEGDWEKEAERPVT